jgi:hypothetical protein
MRPNANSPSATLAPNVTPEEPTLLASVSADNRSGTDAPGFHEHLSQVEFRLTPDRRRILVVIGSVRVAATEGPDADGSTIPAERA